MTGRIQSLLPLLLLVSIICLSGPAIADDEASPPQNTASSTTEIDHAKSDCKGEYRRCMNGTTNVTGNPYSETSCNIAKDTGLLDPSTWEKCKQWCEQQRQTCEGTTP